MVGKQEIMVVCDGADYDKEHILQIISKARSLADESGKIVVSLCIGPRKPDCYAAMFLCGSHKVLVCDQAEELDYMLFCEIAYQVVEKRKPAVLLFPASSYGKAVAAVLSVRFDAGLTADCIDIVYSEAEGFSFIRAAINDSVIAKIQCVQCDSQMCTVKKDVFVKQQRESSFCEVEDIEYSPQYRINNKPEILKSIPAEIKDLVDLSQYKVMFCVGRGVKSQALCDRIRSIAVNHGAALVGTRAAVEDGLIGKEFQVGQSGKGVSPDIYIGFGVAGASQHIVGIKNAKTIIAVNNDENAAIFNYADVAVIEDIETIVEKMELLSKLQ